MNTTDSGRLGEAKVAAKLVELGWYPFIDMSGKCPVDIVAWKNGKTITVQVKSTSRMQNNKYVAEIGTTRPNRSGNTVTKFSNVSCDYLAVFIVPEDRVVIIPASKITAGRRIVVDNQEFVLDIV